jgi:kindlin 2
MGQRKEELLGVAFNRLMRMDLTTGDHIKTWRYNTMKVILSLLSSSTFNL